ncbi:surf-like protein [Elasticomyces elasticus]|nr:surf-like protein [Elasticomyces elasticus]KAK5000163.1 surf-like protein [Elasticomyces elasticus]
MSRPFSLFARPARALATRITTVTPSQPGWVCRNCLRRLPPSQRRLYASPADNADFQSIVDQPAQLVRSGKQHGYGLIVLAIIPVTAFVLGTWQVQRLSWKSDLIARFEDRLVRDPLPLPPQVDPDSVKDFDYRRVYATGTFRHDQEMLIGPRIHDGKDGYLVITPLERRFKGMEGKNTTILVCRGWIPKERAPQSSRPEGLPKGEVTISGLLREPWTKNMFTPDNDPAHGKFYFPDVGQMAQHVGSQPVWIEETMVPDLITAYEREEKGIPIGRPAEVNLRNNHAQYIFTW